MNSDSQTPQPGARCIVRGCENHRHQGPFVGDMCATCHRYITTGKVGPTASFLSQIAAKAPTPDEVVEMALCEVPHVMLRPNQLYRFVVMPGCDKCNSAAAPYATHAPATQ